MRILASPAAAVLVLVLAACSDDPSSTGAGGPLSPELTALTRKHLAPGQVRSVLPLTHLIDLPEGIAVDHQGNIFVGNRRLTGDRRTSEILRISPDNAVSVFATLGPSAPVFDAVRRVIGAITLLGFASPLSADDIDAIGQRLLQSARAVSDALTGSVADVG